MAKDFFSITEQLWRFPVRVAIETRIKNPNPPGTIRDGSTSAEVLRFLREFPGFRTEAQILYHTRRTHSAVSWSLIYLISIGKVESVPDVARNTRYKRYRAKVEK